MIKLNYIWCVLCFAATMVACENDEHTVFNLNLKELGKEEGKNITSYMSTNGKTKAKLTAPLMLRSLYDSAKIEFPKSVQVDFYDSALQLESHLFAKYGRYVEQSNTIFLKDSVFVYTVKNDTLWTDELYWDQTKNIFYTHTPVIISNNNVSFRQKVAGLGGFTSDQSFNNVSLFKVGKPFNSNQNSYILLKDTTQFY